MFVNTIQFLINVRSLILGFEEFELWIEQTYQRLIWPCPDTTWSEGTDKVGVVVYVLCVRWNWMALSSFWSTLDWDQTQKWESSCRSDLSSTKYKWYSILNYFEDSSTNKYQLYKDMHGWFKYTCFYIMNHKQLL